jgi:hypothetical protein
MVVAGDLVGKDASGCEEGPEALLSGQRRLEGSRAVSVAMTSQTTSAASRNQGDYRAKK